MSLNKTGKFILDIGWVIFLAIFTPLVLAFYIVVTPWYGAKETYYDFIGWLTMAWGEIFK